MSHSPPSNPSSSKTTQEESPGSDTAARPQFTKHFPKDPELQRLVDAFAAGHYHIVRKQAEKLAEQTSNPDVAKAARELRRRIEPDPRSLRFLAGAVALLVILTLWAYHVGGH